MLARNVRRRKTALLDFEQDFGGKIDRMIGEMPVNFLGCRELRHAWRQQNAVLDRKNKVYDRVLVCRNCGTTKTQLVSAVTGEIIQRHSYDYPERYLVKGTGRLGAGDRDMIRLASITGMAK